MISKNWKKLKFGDLADFSYGKMPKKEKLKLGNSIVFSGYKYLEKYPEINCKKNDLIIVARGVGGTGDVKIVKRDCYLTNLSIKVNLKNNSGLNPSFFYYSHKINNLRHLDSGSAQSQITITDLIRYEFFVPPILVQNRIVEKLKSIDQLIQKNNRHIKILEEIAQNLYEKWFVNFKFPGYEKVKMVDSELEKIPEGWEIINLIDISEHIIGQSPKSKFYNTNELGLPFHQGVSDFKDRFPNEKTWCTEDKRIAECGDILISVRAPVGRLNIANKKMIIGRGLHAIRSKKNTQNYLFYAIEKYFEINNNLGNGAIFKSVTKRDIQEIQLIFDYSIARQFNIIVKPLDDLIKNLSIKNDLLKETRDLLLPRLISGEIEV